MDFMRVHLMTLLRWILLCKYRNKLVLVGWKAVKCSALLSQALPSLRRIVCNGGRVNNVLWHMVICLWGDLFCPFILAIAFLVFIKLLIKCPTPAPEPRDQSKGLVTSTRAS